MTVKRPTAVRLGENALLARRLMHSIRDKASSKATAVETRTK